MVRIRVRARVRGKVRVSVRFHMSCSEHFSTVGLIGAGSGIVFDAKVSG